MADSGTKEENGSSYNPAVVARLGQIGFVVVLLLVLIGWGRLLEYSWLAGPLFLGFTALFLIVLSALKEPELIYPIVALGLCGYYLTASALGAPSSLFPSLFLLPLFIMWVFGAIVVRRLESRRTLFSAGYLASAFFLVVLVLLVLRGVISRPILVAIPVLGISLFCIERYVYGRRTVPGYFGFILFFTGILLFLSSIPGLSAGYRGILLLVAAAFVMAFASGFQDRVGFGKLLPAYLIGLVFSIAGLAVSWVTRDAFFITCLGFSFHLLGFSKTLALKPTAYRLWETTTFKASFGLANLAAVMVGVLLVVDRFPFRLLPMAACAGYVYFYLTLASRRRRTLLRTRSLYMYAAAFFALSLYYTALVNLIPARYHSMLGLFGLPFLVGVLFLATLSTKRPPVLMKSIYDVGYGVVALSFLLPAVLGVYSHATSVFVGAVFVAVYLIFWAKTRAKLLPYQLVLVSLFMYLSIVSLLGLGLQWLSVALVAPGLVALVLALVSKESGSIRYRLLYTAFFLSSVFSITLVLYAEWLSLYLVAVWAVLYLVAGSIWQRRVSYA